MTDFRSVIASRGKYVGTPAGISMQPMLRAYRDAVSLVEPRFPLQVYDIALYQRANGVYVLHRIVAVKKDGYVFRGDAQFHCERGVKESQIIGVMEGFFRDALYVPAKSFKARLYAFYCVRFYPLRSLWFHAKLYTKKVWNKLRGL